MKIDIEDIKKIAQEAGGRILEFYNSEYDVSYKTADKSSPITEADLASNKIVLNGLRKYEFPILSEESTDDKSRLESEYVWIVDPLDGTSDFIEKTGEFSVMIALAKNGEPVLGVVYEPVKKTFYFAEKGEGAFMEKNGETKNLEVSRVNDFSQMTILLSRNHLLESDVKLCENLKIGKKLQRGSVSKMCVIARGDAEIYVNTSNRTGEWDTCAPHLILEEAGGKITDIFGQRLKYNKEIPKNENGFVSSNRMRHDDIIREIKNIK